MTIATVRLTAMPEPSERDRIRVILGVHISDDDADALLAIHAAMARGLGGVPFEELRQVQPPLQSMPAPTHHA